MRRFRRVVYASSMLRAFCSVHLFIGCALLLRPTDLSAQTAEKTPVQISIADELGDIITKADVEIDDKSTHVRQTLKVNNEGGIRVELYPGNYIFSASSPGFTVSTQHVEVGVSTARPVTFKLAISNVRSDCMACKPQDIPLEHSDINAIIPLSR